MIFTELPLMDAALMGRENPAVSVAVVDHPSCELSAARIAGYKKSCYLWPRSVCPRLRIPFMKPRDPDGSAAGPAPGSRPFAVEQLRQGQGKRAGNRSSLTCAGMEAGGNQRIRRDKARASAAMLAR